MKTQATILDPVSQQGRCTASLIIKTAGNDRGVFKALGDLCGGQPPHGYAVTFPLLA